MTEGRLLTVRDVSLLLGISEKEVLDLVDNHQLSAYKVGGVYLRFKQEQVEEFRKTFKPPPHKHKPVTAQRYSFGDRINDFFYFNDFYILSLLVIVLILIIIFQGY